MQTAGSDVVFLRLDHQLVKHIEPIFSGLGNALGTQKRNALPGGSGNGREDHINLVSFHRNGIDKARLFAEGHSRDTDLRIRAVNADGCVGDLLNQVNEPVKRFQLAVLHRSTHVNKIGAGFRLDFRKIPNPVLIAFGNCFCNGRNGAVDFFTNDNHYKHPLYGKYF